MNYPVKVMTVKIKESLIVRLFVVLMLLLFVMIKGFHRWMSNLEERTKICLMVIVILTLGSSNKSNSEFKSLPVERLEKTIVSNEKVKESVEPIEPVETADTMVFVPLDLFKGKKESKVKSVYKEWMWYLKAREGFIDHVYVCPAGYRTVGYGHNIDAHGWERAKKYMNGNKITYEGATLLLQEDIEIHFREVKRLLSNLNKNQQLAVTALVMNCGLAKVMYAGGKKSNGYSGFWKSCLNGNIPAFYKYNGYKSNGRWKTSSNLKQARVFETLLFKGEMNKLLTMAEIYRQSIIKRDILPAKEKGILK